MVGCVRIFSYFSSSLSHGCTTLCLTFSYLHCFTTKNMLLVICCCITNDHKNLVIFNNKHFLSHPFWESGTWVQLRRIFFASQFLTKLKVLSELCTFPCLSALARLNCDLWNKALVLFLVLIRSIAQILSFTLWLMDLSVEREMEASNQLRNPTHCQVVFSHICIRLHFQ